MRDAENSLTQQLADIERKLRSLEPDSAQLSKLSQAIESTQTELAEATTTREDFRQKDLARRRKKLNEPLSSFGS
jgi:DNA repair exonuclease SbcCD ATPase subunit